MTSETLPITGGCQCGAIRYAIHMAPSDPHLCHCRMCQKAFGSYFAPLAGVRREKFELTRGEPALFRSSGETERGFCAKCGTPLILQDDHSNEIGVALGSLDQPEAIRPVRQYGLEGRMAWFGDLASLPGETTTEEENPASAARIAASNHQHPDHETSEWPPRGADK